MQFSRGANLWLDARRMSDEHYESMEGQVLNYTGQTPDPNPAVGNYVAIHDKTDYFMEGGQSRTRLTACWFNFEASKRLYRARV